MLIYCHLNLQEQTAVKIQMKFFFHENAIKNKSEKWWSSCSDLNELMLDYHVSEWWVNNIGFITMHGLPYKISSLLI